MARKGGDNLLLKFKKEVGLTSDLLSSKTRKSDRDTTFKTVGRGKVNYKIQKGSRLLRDTYGGWAREDWKDRRRTSEVPWTDCEGTERPVWMKVDFLLIEDNQSSLFITLGSLIGQQIESC